MAKLKKKKKTKHIFKNKAKYTTELLLYRFWGLTKHFETPTQTT